MSVVDESILDDEKRIAAGDPEQMLWAIATAGAQVRESAALAAEAGVDRLGEDGRPRAVLVVGMGGSALAGSVLAGVAGDARVPVVVHRGYGVPGWLGAADAVIAVSCSGSTEETLDATEQAVRRGSRVVGVGAAGSPLEELVVRAYGPYVPVPGGRMPRASLWALAVPVLLAGRALRALALTAAELAATADRLDEAAEACRPASESFVNPAKTLALELAATIPMVWGSSALAGVAAYRMCSQLAENAKYPAVHGVLPEAAHNQVAALEGPYGGAAAGAGAAGVGDLFADPDEPAAGPRLRLVLLRDSVEHPRVAARIDVLRELAEARRVGVSELRAEGGSPLERLASLVAVPDFASAYLGLLHGLDPTTIAPIAELKTRLG